MSDALLSFEEIRDKLHARGYSKHHISEEGLSSRDKHCLLYTSDAADDAPRV